MSDSLPASDTNCDQRPRRQDTTRTSGPDWLFSAIIHLLLIALLFTSKAGPGGGGGGSGENDSAHGLGGIAGDRWIEAQLGDESGWQSSASVVVQSPTHPLPIDVAPSELERVVSAAPADSDTPPAVESIVQVGHVQAQAVSPPMPATGLTMDSSQSDAKGSGSSDGRSGSAGRGRDRGDSTPGDGGFGQGGTSLFGIWDSGERFVYVIDRSSSMGEYEKLVAARRELEASLANLDESIEFQVLFYNQEVQPLTAKGAEGLVRASQVNRNRANRQIRLVVAEGGTRHRAALQAAIRLRPTVIYFLTDAESGLESSEIATLARQLAGATRIHCIQFGDEPGKSPADDSWLAQLAAATGGEYRHVRTASLRTPDGESPVRR